MQFFDISIAKRGRTMVCFVSFDLEMSFTPQRHAIVHLSSGQRAPHVALATVLFALPDPYIIGKTPSVAKFLPFRARASSCFSSFLF